MKNFSVSRIIATVFIILSTSMTFGCSAIDMKQYSSNSPQLDLYSYFIGETTGWGIVQDRKGVLTRQFVVHINGTVSQNGDLVLEERFDWIDGEKSTRTWVLQKSDPHSFTGSAEDVSNSATGTLYGNVLNWTYQLLLEVDSTTWKIRFDDWMFLVSENLLLNKATMTKFGFKVGEITIVFDNNYN